MRLPPLRSLVLPVALAAVFTTASSAALALGALADINVIDRSTGQLLPVYTYQGRHYVAGRPGARYAVRVVNQTGARVMAVMSVDGINVVSGDSASPDQNGYVFSAGQRHDVAGWRKSQAQVAAFEFTALPNSYAARTGRPENVGVIGVALFRERAVPVAPVPPVQMPVPPPAPRPYDGAGGAGGVGGWGRDSAARSQAQSEAGSQSAGRSAESAGPASADASTRQAPAAEPAARKSLGSSNDSMAGNSAGSSTGNSASNSASNSTTSEARALSRPAPPAESKLGTGHGARENAWVNYTEFERARSTPDEIITIYYDSRANLVAQGVIPAPRIVPAPQPFPVQPQIGFVPDPPRM